MRIANIKDSAHHSTQMLKLPWARFPRISYGITEQYNALVACYGVTVTLRRCNWVTPRKRFKKSQVNVELMEEAEKKPIYTNINDLKHYLKTTEIPQNLRDGILHSKLASLMENLTPTSFDDETISVVNNVLLQLRKERKCAITDIMTAAQNEHLFQMTADFLHRSQSSKIPEFMFRMIREFVTSKQAVTSLVVVKIIELGERLDFSSFLLVLSYVLKNRGTNLNEDFTRVLFNYLENNKMLNLSSFEDFTAVASSQESTLSLINGDLAASFINYVEFLFADSIPEVHEYKDLNKSLYRLQASANDIISKCLCNVDLTIKLKLLKLKSDLNSVLSNESDVQLCEQILKSVNNHEDNLEDLGPVLQTLAEADESIANTLLLEVAKLNDNFENLKNLVFDHITNSDAYSTKLRWKASFSRIAFEHAESKSDLLAQVENLYRSFSYEDLNSSDALTDALQMYLSSNDSAPDDEFVALLCDVFESNYDCERSILSFKYMIDKAIYLEDSVLAYNLFQESLGLTSIHWNLQEDPRITCTLNRLICSVCKQGGPINEIFPKFREIKQQMSSSVSVEALTCLADKMLNEECVGDTIEMLKRELPKIEKLSTQKLPVSPSCYQPYKRLFDLLHEFVISYEGEKTYETNWVLYGELHKYFHVPFESYLPAMKFFCRVDRLNAALVIFRQIKMLNEVHGSQHVNLPPLREMYMFLLRNFGDRLYEDGVVEIHEYLKVDTDIERQDIELQNSVLNAYSNLQNVGKVRDLFLAISSDSKMSGGINEETIQIMIKTYTYSDMLYVKKFWNSLSQFGVFPNHDIYKQYVIAHTYHGFIEDAVKLIEEIDDYNLEFSPDMMLAMYNYCLDPDKQRKIAKWAEENHQEMWSDLSNSGLLKSASPYMPEKNLLVLPKND